MGRLVGKAQYRDILLGVGLLWATLALVLWPEQAMEAMRDGIKLCGNVILPSLFPFFVLSSLVVELGMSRYLGRLLEPVMAPLFYVNGNCAAALALGFVGGYPVGARTAIQIYENGQCSRTEAERMLAFCNNSGPAFILGVVGAGVFGNGMAGLLLYLTHLLASLCVGVLFRFYKPGDHPDPAGQGGSVSGVQLSQSHDQLSHRIPSIHPQYLRLYSVFYRLPPDFSLRRNFADSGPGPLPPAGPPGDEPDLG